MEKKKIDRRNFLKTVGAAGLGSVCATAKAETNEPKIPEKTQYPQVPRRKLGKTGVDVPILSLGAMYNMIDNQLMLRKTLEWGINYWDTAHMYSNGNSEIGIGKFLAKNPQVRKNVFIVSKASKAKTVADVEKRLQTSLKRMNTDYIDLYYGVHALSDPKQLTDELKRWAEDAKKRGLIRFFGFSTHKNMAKSLSAAAKLGWIDAIMTSYSFRIMQQPEMQTAVEACQKAGIGLIAMKTQAGEQNIKTEKDKKLADHFLQRGFTQGQAKIKVALENKAFASVCTTMKNIGLLTENAAAVLDKTKLAFSDSAVLKAYAKQTCDGFCAGCAEICDAALPNMPYVSDIMRYLMYHNSYGDRDRARELFAKIPNEIRSKLLSTDYNLAEARCPQHLPIAKLICEAVSKLS